jgi:hypothetical protein
MTPKLDRAEPQILLARAFAAMIEAMGLDQRAAAAVALRELPGDPQARRFFTKVAIAIETYQERS